MDDELYTPEQATLREKVDAAKNRLVERTAAAKPVQTVKGLIEEHPVASVAAGILLGALIAKALPSFGRSPANRAADKIDETSGSLRKSAAGFASIAGKMALDYATRAREAGREGLHKAEDVGSTVGEKIVDGSDEAKRKAIDFAEIARSAIIEASESALQKINDLTTRKKG